MVGLVRDFSKRCIVENNSFINKNLHSNNFYHPIQIKGNVNKLHSYLRILSYTRFYKILHNSKVVNIKYWQNRRKRNGINIVKGTKRKLLMIGLRTYYFSVSGLLMGLLIGLMRLSILIRKKRKVFHKMLMTTSFKERPIFNFSSSSWYILLLRISFKLR